jgi:hypothetical protein
MYTLTYKNPRNESERKIITISEFEAKKAIKAMKDKTSYNIPTIGMVQHYNLVFVEKNKQKPEEKEENTHWEINQPTNEQIQAIQIGVLFFNPYFCGSVNFFNGVVKSVWNWQSKKTFEIIKTGEDLIKDGMTMRKMIEELNQSNIKPILKNNEK